MLGEGSQLLACTLEGLIRGGQVVHGTWNTDSRGASGVLYSANIGEGNTPRPVLCPARFSPVRLAQG